MNIYHTNIVVVLFVITIISNILPVVKTQTIAAGYTANPLTCHFLPPAADNFTTFPLIKAYWGTIGADMNPSASVILQVNPTYRFNGAIVPQNWTEGRVFVPTKVTVPLPVCAINTFSWNVFSQPPYATPTTVGCNVPKTLLYGFEDIPVAGAQSLVEIGNIGPIATLFAPRLDPGYPFNWVGTVSWIRPTGCTSPNLSFQLLTNTTGLSDDFALSPSRYTDIASGQTRSCPIPGFFCSNNPRPVGSPIYNASPNIIATCKSLMPFNNSWTTQQRLEYERVFGLGARGPINVASNAITYNFRTDNLVPPVAVKSLLQLDYVAGSIPVDTILGGPSGFDIIQTEVLFKPSLGTHPALAKPKFYNLVSAFIFKYNERQLGFLPACKCGVNVPCDNTNALLEDHVSSTNPDDPAPTGRNKTSVPNFNNAVTFIAGPVCNFTINNGEPVFAGLPFIVTSLSTGGVGTIFYNWQLSHLPPSGGFIASPIQTSLVTVTIFAPTVNFTSTMIMNHTVLNLYGEPVTCTQNFTVYAEGPISSLVPSDTTIFLGQSLTLDGTGSYSPVGGPVQYNFSIVFNPGNAGILLRDPSRAVVLFTTPALGVYVVMLDVFNEISSSSSQAVIRVVPEGTIIPSPLAPSVPVGGNFTCFNPLPPFNFTIPPPTSPTPIAPIPSTPGTPPINPPLFPPGTPGAPGTPPPGVIGPVAQLTDFSKSLFWFMVGTILAILFFAAIFSACYSSKTTTNVLLNNKRK